MAPTPPFDFSSNHFPNGTVKLDSEIYRAGRIARDVLLTCQPSLYGQALKAAGNEVYFYNQNQAMHTPILESMDKYGYGTVHISELVYVFGNLSKFNVEGLPYHPRLSDFVLRDQETRPWSTFVALGRPSLEGHDTLPGWLPAEFEDENFGVYIIGRPNR